MGNRKTFQSARAKGATCARHSASARAPNLHPITAGWQKKQATVPSARRAQSYGVACTTERLDSRKHATALSAQRAQVRGVASSSERTPHKGWSAENNAHRANAQGAGSSSEPTPRTVCHRKSINGQQENRHSAKAKVSKGPRPMG